MNCQHCKAENEGGWFYCRECGKRAHAPRYSTATIIRDSRFATVYGRGPRVKGRRNQWQRLKRKLKP